MAMTRCGFLMLASGQFNPYSAPGKSSLAEVGYADDATAEKRRAPVPVGAESAAAFRTRCVGCFKCVTACPRGILRPSKNPRHFGRPQLDFRFGWCRPECNRCAEACPAGAIRRGLTPEQKLNLHTGVAVWHPDRCVAASGKDKCNACTRHCPTGAISLVPRPGAAADAPKIPKVDAERCMGCGACEHFCPARPKAAILVEGRT